VLSFSSNSTREGYKNPSIEFHVISHAFSLWSSLRNNKESERRRKKQKKRQRNRKITNKIWKFRKLLITYINLFTQLHSIKWNYLILDILWDEWAANQRFRLDSIEEVESQQSILFLLSFCFFRNCSLSSFFFSTLSICVFFSLRLVFSLIFSLYVFFLPPTSFFSSILSICVFSPSD
jgi:hypothetical protein